MLDWIPATKASLNMTTHRTAFVALAAALLSACAATPPPVP
jgi:starvation-inducible outer membrane lipoprotein